MRFEQALQAMREGKKVRRPTQCQPTALIQNRIVAIYQWEIRKKDIRAWYEPLEDINCENILAEDWEIVEDEPQS